MCLTVDGFGDFVSTMMAVGRGRSIDVLERVHFPHSLGLFYTAVTQFLGFPGFGDEYKVMGLAAYGEPSFADRMGRIVPPRPDGTFGTFGLDLRYFRHLSEGVDMTWEDGAPELGTVFTPALEELLGPARRPGEELTQRHKDMAASLQKVYEDRFFALVRALGKRTGMKKLALAGGCAMNSLANGRARGHLKVFAPRGGAALKFREEAFAVPIPPFERRAAHFPIHRRMPAKKIIAVNALAPGCRGKPRVSPQAFGE